MNTILTVPNLVLVRGNDKVYFVGVKDRNTNLYGTPITKELPLDELVSLFTPIQDINYSIDVLKLFRWLCIRY